MVGGVLPGRCCATALFALSSEMGDGVMLGVGVRSGGGGDVCSPSVVVSSVWRRPNARPSAEQWWCVLVIFLPSIVSSGNLSVFLLRKQCGLHVLIYHFGLGLQTARGSDTEGQMRIGLRVKRQIWEVNQVDNRQDEIGLQENCLNGVRQSLFVYSAGSQ
jgi:hypothetical protein